MHACPINVKNTLILNYPKELTMRAHLIHYEDYLNKLLKSSDVLKVDWVLRSTIIDRIPKHLNICLSKSLLNFSRKAHQLHRKKL